MQSLYFLISGYTARFVSDLVGNPEDRFSHNDAHLLNNTRFVYTGPDPEMLLPGGGGTESRSLEPSSESREGEGRV